MPDTPWLYLLGLLLAGLLGAAPGLYGKWREGKKLDAEGDKAEAEAAAVLVTAAVDMAARWESRVKALECDVDSLRARVKVLEEERDELLRGASRLEGQVVSLGHEPVFRVSELRQKQAGQ